MHTILSYSISNFYDAVSQDSTIFLQLISICFAYKQCLKTAETNVVRVPHNFVSYM